MASYNRIVIVGNLTRDPELKYTPAGTALCKFGIATNRKFKRGDGSPGEEVCFVTCVAWAKTGEVANEHLRKGSQALVEGRLTFSTWQDDGGNKHSKHEISVERVVFLGRPQQRNDSVPATREQEETQEQPTETQPVESPPQDTEEDEVPF